MNREIDFNEVPESWAICSLNDCADADKCLRYRAFQVLPPTVAEWPCVMRSAQSGGTCSYFASSEKVRLARGFEQMMASLQSRDARLEIRQALTNYLGSKGTYYRYKHGERLLSCEQQQWIRQLFATYGYDHGLEFDAYITTYQFRPHS